MTDDQLRALIANRRPTGVLNRNPPNNWPLPAYPKNPPPPLARAFDWDDAPEDKYEPEPEIDDDYEVGICPTCNGSGEGMFDGSTCRDCGGMGER